MRYAKVIDQNEAIVDRLRELRLKTGMSYQQVAAKSGYPESTVTRIFSGKTPNPTVATVIAMWKAMGGKATELFDDTVKVDVTVEEPQVVVPQIDAKLYEHIIKMYEQSNKSKDKWIKALVIILSVLTLFILTILLADILHGGVGHI